MVPAAQLYTRVVAHAISRQRLGALIKLKGDLRAEILHWHFLDSWTGCVPWRPKEHKVVRLLASKASQSRWGATLSLPSGVETTGDYFSEDLGHKDSAPNDLHYLFCQQCGPPRQQDTPSNKDN